METIKEEKKTDLEQLLNNLIEKGWKPFGEGCHRSPYKRVGIHKNYNKERTYVLFYSNNHSHWKVLRQVVSKESGLWQFVCENMLINKKWFYGDEYCVAEHCEYTPKYHKFRLIESSLIDESELEDFLLNSIKID